MTTSEHTHHAIDYIEIPVTDLDRAKRFYGAAGGEITAEPFAFPGGRRFHFRDPDGHELAVWATA